MAEPPPAVGWAMVVNRTVTAPGEFRNSASPWPVAAVLEANRSLTRRPFPLKANRAPPCWAMLLRNRVSVMPMPLPATSPPPRHKVLVHRFPWNKPPSIVILCSVINPPPLSALVLLRNWLWVAVMFRPANSPPPKRDWLFAYTPPFKVTFLCDDDPPPCESAWLFKKLLLVALRSPKVNSPPPSQ